MRARMLETRDLPALAELLRAVMRETFDKPWSGSVDALARDAFGKELRVAVAGEPLAGFIGWTPTYDLHHAISGATVCDMFVQREHRGRGVALELVCFAAARIRADGGLSDRRKREGVRAPRDVLSGRVVHHRRTCIPNARRARGTIAEENRARAPDARMEFRAVNGARPDQHVQQPNPNA